MICGIHHAHAGDNLKTRVSQLERNLEAVQTSVGELIDTVDNLVWENSVITHAAPIMIKELSDILEEKWFPLSVMLIFGDLWKERSMGYT